MLPIRLIFYTLICISVAVSGQSQNTSALKFQNLGTNEGLSRALVRQIVRDQYGWIWVATENGLNRFDGYRFEVFRYQKDNPGSLPDNNVYCLADGGKYGLIAGLQSGKVVRYDHTRQKFETIFFADTLIQQAFARSQPDYIVLDSTQCMWIATTNGLFAHSIKTGRTRHFHPGNSKLGSPYVKHIYFDSKGSMWLSTDAGAVHLLNYTQHGMESMESVPLQGLPSPYVKRITEDQQGFLWIGSDGGLSKYNKKNQQYIAHYAANDNQSNSIANNYTKALITTRIGLIWAGHDMGASVINPITGKITNHQAGFEDKYGIVNNYVKCIYEDNHQIVWIGTDQGISYYDPVKEPFKNIVQRVEGATGLKGNIVYQMVQTDAQTFWIATNKGLHKWNKCTGEMLPILHERGRPGTLASNIVRSLAVDTKGRLWVGTDNGVNVLENPAGPIRFSHIAAGPANGKNINNMFVVTIKQLSDGNMWVGTWGGGINIIEPNSKSVQYFSAEHAYVGYTLHSNQIANIFEDSHHNVWLRSGQIFHLPSQTMRKFPDDVPVGSINFFYEDQTHKIWIGTTSNGLYQYDPATRTLSRPTQHPLLQDGVVVSMQQDKQGNYWIAANRQLVKLSKDLQHTQIFDASEGLQGGDFSNECAYTDEKGILYFGGNPGFTYFDPATIQVNHKPVRVYLTALWLDNAILPATHPILQDSSFFVKKKITLPHNHRDLIIHFTGINFTNPQKNTYFYKIEGLQSDWVPARTEAQFAKFFQLPPGHHRFVVKALNSSGIESAERAWLEIEVLKPWYQWNWVRVAAILVATGLILLFIRWRTHTLSTQKQLLEEKVYARTGELEWQKAQMEEKNRQLEAASRAKSEFLANMSHEIRTPLNGVIGFTELLKSTPLSEVQKEYVDNANNSGHTLLGIINDILDFSKIEAGMLELETVYTNIPQLLGSSIDIIKYSAAQKNVEVLLNIDPALPRYAQVDPVRLKQVLANLLSNAIKFTEQGEVELIVRYTPTGAQMGALYFAIRDTGIGISQAQKEKLFKSFSQADSSTTRKFGGTGLGLVISQMIVQKMGGSIDLQSQPGQGSTFFFTINTQTKADGEEPASLGEKINTCLIVDDNSNNRTILQGLLQYHHVTVSTAASGKEAIEKLKSHGAFDVILCDYHMPEMDGIALTGYIRDTMGWNDEKQPIILLHSSADTALLHSQSKILEIRYKLTKPIKADDLLTYLKEIKQPRQTQATGVAVGGTAMQQATLFASATPVILVAEDVALNFLLIKTVLKNLLPNCKVLEAKTGKEALEKNNEENPDLILMDIHMPEMDGIEATELIRAQEAHLGKHTPIVALTAGALKEEQEKCSKAGMDDFLTKPISKEKLTEFLYKFLTNQYQTNKPSTS